MLATSKRTALNYYHKKLKGKMIDFVGYELPIWYNSMREEHQAVRTHMGMFDISHMGLFEIRGKNNTHFLQSLSCNDVRKAVNQKMVYSMFLNPDGGILDDVMHGQYQDRFYLITNGANQAKIGNWMNEHLLEHVRIRELNKEHAFIAIQGPKAVSLLTRLFQLPFNTIPRFGIEQFPIHNVQCMVFRSGYTGEDGFELMIPNESAESIWDTLLEEGVVPCGLGARDTLRIEYGLPLYSHELSEAIHPFMTRYGWVVKTDTDFIGKDAILKLKDKPKWVSVGLELEGRHIARQGYPIIEGGEVTSGTLSPSLDKPIALAFVSPECASIGQSVTINLRGKHLKAKVVEIPFK